MDRVPDDAPEHPRLWEPILFVAFAGEEAMLHDLDLEFEWDDDAPDHPRLWEPILFVALAGEDVMLHELEFEHTWPWIVAPVPELNTGQGSQLGVSILNTQLNRYQLVCGWPKVILCMVLGPRPHDPQYYARREPPIQETHHGCSVLVF